MSLPRIFAMVIATAVTTFAQSFVSGSTGANGALNLTTPGTFVFDPGSFNPPLNPSADNIFHFTSIYIAAGVTVKISSGRSRGPIFWLAQGPVVVNGALDLNGADADAHRPSVPGAGGYPGGAAGKVGYHPEGFTPNQFLVPLVGGFGGDGGLTQGGGAGGGALLIASSASITVRGAITADGGGSGDGNGGGGGAIRLVAPLIDGMGILSAKGGAPGGADGRVRLEAMTNQFEGSLNGGTPLAEGKPLGLFLPPTPQPSIRVAGVNGIRIQGNEFAINTGSRLLVSIEAHYVPLGTTVELQVFPDNGAAQSFDTTPLEGSLAFSAATASVTVPSGSSRAFVKAEWKQARGSDSSK